ncbi:MAG: cytochrome c [Steroidobacteraceae bacterium]
MAKHSLLIALTCLAGTSLTAPIHNSMAAEATTAAILAAPPSPYPPAAPGPYSRPEWAFLTTSAQQPAAKKSNARMTAPGSTKIFTNTEINNFFDAVDWYPERHAPMPLVVAKGRKPDVLACAVCHLASGMGHAESSHLAGQPVDYILAQMADFKSGARKDPARMTRIGTATTEEEARTAAEWFAAIKPITWLKVIETDRVPLTYGNAGRMQLPWPGKGTELLGNRIVELPQDVARALLRDPNSGFIAYVPKGSVTLGKQLVQNGTNGAATACAACHGPELLGTKDVPSIAGTSPLYAARQLYNFQVGDRAGSLSALMQPVVDKMTENDIIAVTAYLATLPP